MTDASRRKILLATSVEHPQLTADDLLAAAALRERGFVAEPVVWNAVQPEQLSGAAAVVVRSCWDYHLQPQAFADWLAGLARLSVPTINSVPLMGWNLHKRYLLELEARGASVVPTILLERGPGSLQIEDLLARASWGRSVVKPAISLSAHDTWRVDLESATEYQARFDVMRSRGDVLVQCYIPEVSAGEWSLVFFGGEYSHAVLKRPAQGDFRVQQEHGGSAHPAAPSAKLIEDALAVLTLLPETPTYARVDGVEVESRLLLMELECIDPVLFFEHEATAAARFADQVERQIAALKH